MKKIRLSIEPLRKIFAANFVKRQPPYNQWSRRVLFTPPHHFLYFHIKGEREITHSGRSYQLNSGDTIFFFGKSRFLSPAPTTAYEALNISFNTCSEDAFFANPLPEPDEKFLAIPWISRLGENSSIRYLFEEVVYNFLSASKLNNWKAVHILHQLLIELASSHAPLPPLPAAIDAAINLIERNPHDKYSLDDLAKKTNMSRASLTRHFRAATGKSIHEFHLDVKLKHALAILQNNPSIKIREISETFGFYDEYHFSKMFKMKFGAAPSKFKSS